MPTPGSPGRLAFRALPVGATFEFDHVGLAVSCGAIAHGPWRKISPLCYVPAAAPVWASRPRHRVGSPLARVRLGDDCGRRAAPVRDPRCLGCGEPVNITPGAARHAGHVDRNAVTLVCEQVGTYGYRAGAAQEA